MRASSRPASRGSPYAEATAWRAVASIVADHAVGRFGPSGTMPQTVGPRLARARGRVASSSMAAMRATSRAVYDAAPKREKRCPLCSQATACCFGPGVGAGNSGSSITISPGPAVVARARQKRASCAVPLRVSALAKAVSTAGSSGFCGRGYTCWARRKLASARAKQPLDGSSVRLAATSRSATGALPRPS